MRFVYVLPLFILVASALRIIGMLSGHYRHGQFDLPFYVGAVLVTALVVFLLERRRRMTGPGRSE